MKESELKAQVLAALRKRGHWCVKIAAGPYQAAGLPDVFACIRGVFVAMELKVGRNKPSAIQQRVLAEMTAAGAVAGVVYTIGEAIRLIERAETMAGLSPNFNNQAGYDCGEG